jgi:hypothetical protein
MKKTGLLYSFFLISGREIVKNLAAFFRFTEAGGCNLVSAYGLQVLKLDQLQNNPANEQKETGEGSGSYLTNSARMDGEDDTGLQFQDPVIRQKRSVAAFLDALEEAFYWAALLAYLALWIFGR